MVEQPVLSPPPVRRALKTPPASSSPTSSTSSSNSDYMRLSSGTFCRLRATRLAPMTPTLEHLARRSALKPRYSFHRDVERLVAHKLDLLQLQGMDTSSESGYGSDEHELAAVASVKAPPTLPPRGATMTSTSAKRRVRFDSYVMLLQGLRERNAEMVRRHALEVRPEAMATDEVVSALASAVLDGHDETVGEALRAGADANATVDNTGLTYLHLAASANNLPLVKLLLSHGACVYARAHSSGRVAADLCQPLLPGYQACLAYLRCMGECLGVAAAAVAHVARGYPRAAAGAGQLLRVQPGQSVLVVKRGDYAGSDWWWCRLMGEDQHGDQHEGYVLKDLLSLNPPTCAAFSA